MVYTVSMRNLYLALTVLLLSTSQAIADVPTIDLKRSYGTSSWSESNDSTVESDRRRYMLGQVYDGNGYRRDRETLG